MFQQRGYGKRNPFFLNWKKKNASKNRLIFAVNCNLSGQSQTQDNCNPNEHAKNHDQKRLNCMHTAPPFQVQSRWSRVSSQNLIVEIRPPGYFELTASFAQRKKAKGRRNQNIHTALSNFRQIAASDLSGNKLILIISFPPSSRNSQSA